MCELCGKRKARGGHRFCYACLGAILSQPAPQPQIRESSAIYPLPRRKGK